MPHFTTPVDRLPACLRYAACAWTAAWLAGCAIGSGTVPPADVPGAPYQRDGVFEFSASGTTANFKVAVVDLVSVTGEFRQSSGRLVLGPKGRPQRVEVELKSGSADAGADWINDMLLGPKFFNATQHPNVTFRAEQFGMVGDTLNEVIGDLTLRGITKPVTLKVNRFDCRQAAKDDGDQRARCVADATTQVKRTDFDMKSWLDSVSESIRIDIKFTAYVAQ